MTLLFPRLVVFVILVFTVPFAVDDAAAQESGKQYVSKNDPKLNRRRGIYLLSQIKDVLRSQYYDPTFGGLDMDKKFKDAEETIKTQEFNWQIYRTIASVITTLNDSHTYFFPPDRAFRVEYGFSTMIIGNSCFVIDVKKGSDAAAKGLHSGDEILTVNGIEPNRDNYSQINYIIYGLDPQEVLKLNIKSANGDRSEVQINSKFISPDQRKKEWKAVKDDESSKPYTCKELSSELIACKLRTFETEKGPVDRMIKEINGHSKLILDLRGNGGGRETVLNQLLGFLFENDVTVGTERSRKKPKDWVVPGGRDKSFKGELAVLIDSESGSASEVLARVVQLRKRGVIYGDTSAGAVMGAYQYAIGIPINEAAASANFGGYTDQMLVSLFQVTVTDLVMADGTRLERVGVVPDFRIGPNGLALRQQNDPVLAILAEKFGVPLTPEAAARLNFFIPKKEEVSDPSSEGNSSSKGQ